MRNTVEEIILKCERQFQWKEWQGYRGRFQKGNPGRGFDRFGKQMIDDHFDEMMFKIHNEFKTLTPVDKIYVIKRLMKFRRFKDDPDEFIAILEGFFFYTVVNYLNQNKLKP